MRWNPLPGIFYPGWHLASRKFMARRIKDECPHVLRVQEFFQIVVDAALSTTLIRIHRLGQNLRTLALDPMPRRTHGNRHQNRQHQKQRLGGPERQENPQEKASHYYYFLRLFLRLRRRPRKHVSNSSNRLDVISVFFG